MWEVPGGDIVHLTPVTLVLGRFSSSAPFQCQSSMWAGGYLVLGDSPWRSVKAGLGSQDPSHPQLEASNCVSLNPTHHGDKDSVVVASQIRSHGLRSAANSQVSSSGSV